MSDKYYSRGHCGGRVQAVPCELQTMRTTLSDNRADICLLREVSTQSLIEYLYGYSIRHRVPLSALRVQIASDINYQAPHIDHTAYDGPQIVDVSVQVRRWGALHLSITRTGLSPSYLSATRINIPSVKRLCLTASVTDDQDHGLQVLDPGPS